MLLNVWLLLVIFTLYVAWCIEIICLFFAVNNSFINIDILLIEGRDSIYLAYFWVCTKEPYKRRFIYFWQTYDNNKIEISVWSSVMSSYISLASLLRSWLIPRSSVCKVSPRVIYQWNRSWMASTSETLAMSWMAPHLSLQPWNMPEMEFEEEIPLSHLKYLYAVSALCCRICFNITLMDNYNFNYSNFVDFIKDISLSKSPYGSSKEKIHFYYHHCHLCQKVKEFPLNGSLLCIQKYVKCILPLPYKSNVLFLIKELFLVQQGISILQATYEAKISNINDSSVTQCEVCFIKISIIYIIITRNFLPSK